MAETKLILPNGNECEDLGQLRNGFTGEWALKVLEDGTIFKWLDEMMYEDVLFEMEKINLDDADKKVVDDFRLALGLVDTTAINKAKERLTLSLKSVRTM